MIIGLAYFLEWVDAYALCTALVPIAHEFHTDPINMKEALTVYLISAGMFIPISTWVAERYGLSLVYRYAILVFLLGSIGAAVSPNTTILIIFRFIQGVGGAFLTPLGRLIMLHLFGKDRIPEAMAKITVVSTLGMVVGPLLGGALTTWLSWRWVFIINIPFGFAGFILTGRYLPSFQTKIKQVALDYRGFILLGGSFALLLFIFDIIPISTISTSFKISGIVTSLFLFCGYCINSYYTKYPLYPSIIFNRRFSLSLFGSFLTRLGISAPVFLVPLLLQASYHYTAFEAGSTLVPTALGVLLGKKVLKNVMKHSPKHVILYLLCFLNTISLLSLGFLSTHLSPIVLVIAMFFFGLVMSMQQTAMNTHIYKLCDKVHYGAAVSGNSVVIQLSASFSIAIAGMCLMLNVGNFLSMHNIEAYAFYFTFKIIALFPLIAWFIFWLSEKRNEIRT